MWKSSSIDAMTATSADTLPKPRRPIRLDHERLLAVFTPCGTDQPDTRGTPKITPSSGWGWQRVPRLVGIGEPFPGCPGMWSLWTWLPGNSLDQLSVADHPTLSSGATCFRRTRREPTERSTVEVHTSLPTGLGSELRSAGKSSMS